jgi:ABC-type phosphate transport system substrate-binding protein
MRNLKSLLMATSALACFGAAETANAQTVVGAGATFPSTVYRELIDCLYMPMDGSPGKPGPLPIAAACPSFPFGDASGWNFVWMYYAPTGSGGGKSGLRANSAGSAGSVSSTATIPYTSAVNGVTTFPYPALLGYHFSGSDDVINAADMAAWNAGGASSPQSKFGNLIQFPTIAGAVAVAFNGNDGTGAPLNINPANYNPPGSTSQLNLSRKALCGIVSGHIRKWDDPILTALNGGTTLGTGNITVVHRFDGSGTTFLFTNALSEQCRFEFGPMNESVSTLVSYAFPWTDRTVASSLCSTTLLVAQGANAINWPDWGTDQCGVAIPNPGGGTFANPGSSGNSATVALVTSTNGAITYTSTDSVLPVKVGGLKTANLQSQWDLTAVTGQFQAPTTAGTKTAMESAIPIFTPATRANPLTWSLQGTVPNPSIPGAYPIAGFTWMEMYQCYDVSTGNNAHTFLTTFLNFIYGSPDATNIINANGFSEVPYAWIVEIFAVLNDPALTPSFTGIPGSPCELKVGAK